MSRYQYVASCKVRHPQKSLKKEQFHCIGISFPLFQQVMRFAELTQEVQVARQAQVRFDNGLTPGRRRLNRQYKEAVAKMQEEGGRIFVVFR